MSVIIRLQNLPWSANALDIRTFFRGLSIPDGGVHIVGGEMGDAFIAFSTDEDARQAMMLDGRKLKEVQIKLLLSSRAEMQKVIETARQSSLNMLQIPAGQKSSQSYKTAQSGSAAQPPAITSSSLGKILPQQSAATLNINENSSQSYQSNMALLSQNENSADSRESRIDSSQMGRYKKLQTNNRHRNYSRSHSRSRSSSHSCTRDRRRSRSRDRDRNIRRRERSRSRSMDRHDRRRRSSSQENSRDNDYENSRDSIKRVADIKGTQQTELKLGSLTQKNEIADAKSNPISVWNLPQPPVAYTSPSGANAFSTNLNQLQSMGQFNFAAFAAMMPPHLQQQQQFMMNQTQNPQVNQYSMQTNQKQMQKENQFTYPLHSLNERQQIQNPLNMANTNSSMMQKQDDPRSQMIFQTGYNFQQLGARNMPNNQREKVFDSQSSDFRDTKRSRNSPRREHRRRSRSPARKHSPPNYLSKRLRDPRDRTDINYDAIEGNCIKISNMCPTTTYSELRRFFSGLHIANNGIKMINDDDGERVGTAYIQFVKKESKPKAFVRNNEEFKKKRVVIESVTEDEFDQAIDSYKPERVHSLASGRERSSPIKSDLENRGNRGSPNDSNAEPGKEKKKEFSCLFLQDLPPFAKEQDIIKMFSSYVLFDILLTREKDNRRQYVCYVKFHRPEDAKNALEESSKHKIAHKHIIISKCSNAEFEKAKEKYTTREEEITDQPETEADHKTPGPGDNSSPESRTEIPIVTMTDSFEVNQKENNSLDMQGVMQNMEISNSFNKDPRQPMTAPSDPRRRGTRFSRPDDNKNKTKFAILRNCDYKATEKDYEMFFTDLGIIPNRIHILTNNRHQPTGECIIEFNSTEDAEKSLFKNNAIFGSRTVRVELITEKNVKERLNENYIDTNTSPAMPEEHIQVQQPESASFDRAIQDQIINYICSQYGNDILGNTPNNPQPEPQMNMVPNMQEEHITQEEIVPRNNPFRNNNTNMLTMNTKENTRGNSNQGQSNSRRHGRPSRFSDVDNGINKNRNSGNNNNRQHHIVVPELNNSTVDMFGKPGCVVGLENVPFKADTNDILEFFREFNIHPRNVIRRYNDDGTPTGDARVAFSSPMEARAAIEQKRLQKIFNRTIYLALV